MKDKTQMNSKFLKVWLGGTYLHLDHWGFGIAKQCSM